MSKLRNLQPDNQLRMFTSGDEQMMPEKQSEDRSDKKDESTATEGLASAAVDKDAIAAEAGYRLGTLSLEAEISRYESLSSGVSHLMTVASIESVALLALLAVLLEYSSFAVWHVSLCYAVVFGLLLATMMVAVVARFRFTYEAPASPLEYGQRVKDQFFEFDSKADGACFFCESIQRYYESLRERNDRIVKLVSMANALALLSLVAIALSAISLASSLV